MGAVGGWHVIAGGGAQARRRPEYVRRYVTSTGGVKPAPRKRSERCLSKGEREEISRGLARGDSCRVIAAGIGRSHTTVSREVGRNGGRERYRAHDADEGAWRRARRPKDAKLVVNARLREVVEERLELEWSPAQISAWLGEAYPDDLAMRVSHETIYLSLFVQSRGALRHELCDQLRRRRRTRRPRGRPAPQGRGQIREMVMISERPAEVEDRAVPGHWEGDLLLGSRVSGIATLVERTSRYTQLVALPARLQGRARACRTDAEYQLAAGAAVALADLGSGQGDGRARPLQYRQRRESVLLRSTQPLAAWDQ